MAIKLVQIIEDDFDGSPATTVAFSFEGVQYEIDLSDTRLNELRSALEPYVSHARRARGARNSTRRPASSGSSPLRGRTTTLTDKGLNAAEIRAWAQANGKEISDRGRIPDSLVQEFEDSKKSSAAKTPAKKAPAKKAVAAKKTAAAAFSSDAS